MRNRCVRPFVLFAMTKRDAAGAQRCALYLVSFCPICFLAKPTRLITTLNSQDRRSCQERSGILTVPLLPPICFSFFFPYYRKCAEAFIYIETSINRYYLHKPLIIHSLNSFRPETLNSKVTCYTLYMACSCMLSHINQPDNLGNIDNTTT